VLAVADQTDGSGWFNGDDAITLERGGVILDSIGQIGVDPGAEWGSGLTSTQDGTLQRKASVTAGDTDPTDAFDPATGWDGFATDTFDGLGAHASGPAPDTAPTVTSTAPGNRNSGVAPTESLEVEFSEPVELSGDAFWLVCSGSAIGLTVSGGPTTYTLAHEAQLPQGAGCTLTVHADRVRDLDGTSTRMADDLTISFTVADCSAGYAPAYAIQGDRYDATTTGRLSTQGVVVGDYEAEGLRGFYLQDADGDGDPATSDAIFVFNGSDDDVELGDLVRVYGTPGEFQGQTQLSAFSNSVTVCGKAGAGDVPTVSPAEVALPFADALDRERYEGMLVSFPQELTVTELFQLGRFGQVTLSSGGRLDQPTNVAAPGEEAVAVQQANDLNRIIVDDASQRQNPDPVLWARDGSPLTAENTLRGGDSATGLVGVMTYTWGGNAASPNAFRVRPIGALGGGVDFEAANLRTDTPQSIGGSLKVASFNVLNYFDDFSGCTGGVAPDAEPMDCRGADDQRELDRQAAKIVAALQGLDADVFGLIEIENDGYGPDSALADLVERLNAKARGGTYRYLDVDARTEQVDALGDDAIKVAMIYKPGAVVPNGETAVLNSDSFVNGDSGEPRNRPALAQTFLDRSTGGRFTLVVNHLKSKGSDCDEDGDRDTGDGQGNCNQTRVDAAEELVRWIGTHPTGMADPDVLVMGDLNSYAMEDPVTAIKDAGYVDLHGTLEEDAYSYVFDGQWGYLDHALASSSLAHQVAGLTTWHINADEPPVLDYDTDFKSDEQEESLYAPTPFRSSDHDPVLVGLDLDGPL
jgi:predicted extracellular nuclease